MNSTALYLQKPPLTGNCFAPLGAGQVTVASYSKAKRKNKRFLTSARATAYEYQLACLHPQLEARLPRFRYDLELERKRTTFRLSDIQCFHPDTSLEPVEPSLSFLRKLDHTVLAKLIDAASPLVGISKKGRPMAVSNQLLLALAQYVAPYHQIRTRLLVKFPTRSLTYLEAVNAVQKYYQPFVETNKQLLACIATTNIEAELLSGYSKSHCYDLRKNHAIH